MQSTCVSFKTCSCEEQQHVYSFTGATSPAILNSVVTLFLLQLPGYPPETKLKSRIQSYLNSFSCIMKAI